MVTAPRLWLLSAGSSPQRQGRRESSRRKGARHALDQVGRELPVFGPGRSTDLWLGLEKGLLMERHMTINHGFTHLWLCCPLTMPLLFGCCHLTLVPAFICGSTVIVTLAYNKSLLFIICPWRTNINILDVLKGGVLSWGWTGEHVGESASSAPASPDFGEGNIFWSLSPFETAFP